MQENKEANVLYEVLTKIAIELGYVPMRFWFNVSDKAQYLRLRNEKEGSLVYLLNKFLSSVEETFGSYGVLERLVAKNDMCHYEIGKGQRANPYHLAYSVSSAYVDSEEKDERRKRLYEVIEENLRDWQSKMSVEGGRKMTRKRYSREELKAALLAYYKQKGHWPSAADCKFSDDLPSYYTIRQKIGPKSEWDELLHSEEQERSREEVTESNETKEDIRGVVADIMEEETAAEEEVAEVVEEKVVEVAEEEGGQEVTINLKVTVDDKEIFRGSIVSSVRRPINLEIGL